MNNIIKATFSGCDRMVYTRNAYQYDYGMVLKIEGVELPQAYEVHFSNSEWSGNSKPQIGDENGCIIPDEYFVTGLPIYAWTYLHTGADDGETVYKAIIGIYKRAKPTNQQPTPVQQDAITQAIAALNVAVEQTGQDVIDATAAKEAAELAQGKSEDAQEAAELAQGKAEDAQEAAETAQGKAEAAQEGAETAQGKAEDAQEAAEGFSRDSEAWAVGERNGVPVAVDDPTYDNNAKFYSELAEQSAATSGYMFFFIDERGHLIYQHTPNVDVDFYLNNGHLYVRASA